MKTFRNKNFTKRNYECTNVVICQAESAPDANWIECDESEIKGMAQLWTTNGVRFFGWM